MSYQLGKVFLKHFRARERKLLSGAAIEFFNPFVGFWIQVDQLV
jgi:hypothetical protein